MTVNIDSTIFTRETYCMIYDKCLFTIVDILLGEYSKQLELLQVSKSNDVIDEPTGRYRSMTSLLLKNDSDSGIKHPPTMLLTAHMKQYYGR